MGYQGVTDIEYWRPSFQPGRGRVGRPVVVVERTHRDYPAPTPQPTPCLLWQGAVDKDGYGCLSGRGITNNHTKIRAHRWVWEAVHGPLYPGLVVRHKCDNRVCFRLSHLELGTVADNNRDAQERGHLGPVRAMAPSEIASVMARRATGELWTSIAADYPQYSLATVKRAKDYVTDI